MSPSHRNIFHLFISVCCQHHFYFSLSAPVGAFSLLICSAKIGVDISTSGILGKNAVDVGKQADCELVMWTNVLVLSSQYNRNATFNSLVPGKFEWNFIYVIFKWISVIDGWGISCEIALIWMSLDFTDDQSTLVQVMAWCRQATSHYPSQCWLRSLPSYGDTGPQWVNSLVPGRYGCSCKCVILKLIL